jgi:hypothetical protein
VRSNPLSGSRFVRMLATCIAFAGGIACGVARADVAPGSSQIGDISQDREARIQALVERWFALLENPSVEPEALNDLLPQSPFDLLLEGEVLRDRNGLMAWVARLHATYPQLAYALGPIQIQPEVSERYRVQFEFDRHASDRDGLPHVARREQTWIVRSDSNGPPVILSIEEKPLLFYSGTGPQIVCY